MGRFLIRDQLPGHSKRRPQPSKMRIRQPWALQHPSCFCFLPDRAFLAAPAADHGLDALRQEALRERLSDEIVSAQLEAKYLVKFIVFGA
jgi:hypothetical protein